MAKPVASDGIMPADKMKPLLAAAKQEAVQAAMALTSDGEAVLLLDKKTKPQALMAALKSTAAKAGIALQSSTLRCGTARVDPAIDASLVEFSVNKETPGAMRPKMIEVLKKISYQKVEFKVDPSLDQGGADATEPVAGGTAPTEEAPAGQDQEAGLRHALGELVQRIPAVAGDDAGRKAILLKAAAVANDEIKGHDVSAATAAIEKLRKVFDALAGQAAAHGGAQDGPLLPIWLDAKETVDDQIGKLQVALKGFDDPDLNRIAEYGLNGISGKNSVGLMTALREADAPGGGDGARKKLSAAIESYQSFLRSNKIVALIDTNPFGISIAVRSTLGGALDTLSKRIAA